MLRGNSSKRLGRSKSTSSAYGKHEPMDPEMARYHAQTAATLAFARAQERNSADAGNRGGLLSRNNSTTQSTQDTQGRPSLSRNESTASNGIKRQQSVRFAGPNAVQRRQSTNARTAQQSLQSKSSTATLRPTAITTNAPVPAIYRPPSRSSSIGKTSCRRRGGAESFVTSNAFEEYYTREDDVASTPSSYRRVRKSKSMFSPLKAPSVFYTNGTPERNDSSFDIGRRHSISNRSLRSQPSQAALRGPKSMSFLRGRRDQNQDRNDNAVQLARDRFFQETTQQRLREQPSFLFRSKAQRQEKPFRKSVRSSSGIHSTADIGGLSENEDRPRNSSLKLAARKASETIKKKLKRVFRRNKEEPPVEIPNQQVDARETHVREYNSDINPSEQQFANIPMPDPASLSRVATRVPSIHAVNSNQQLRSHAGSLKSMRSFRSEQSDDKSRVTSWTSTGVNTVTSQGARSQPGETVPIPQRLSIINENGTHISTSSFSRPRLSNQISAYPLTHRASKSLGHVPIPGAVDSARVYSALMKRLDENSPQGKSSNVISHPDSDLTNFDFNDQNQNYVPPLPKRSNSVGGTSRDFQTQTPATIRHVVPTECGSNHSQDGNSVINHHHWTRADSVHAAQGENVFGYTGTQHVHQWVTADRLREARMMRCEGDDVFTVSSNKENIPVRQPFRNPSFSNGNVGVGSVVSYNPSTKTSYHTVPEPEEEDGREDEEEGDEDLTPQEIARMNEPVIPPLPQAKLIREARSTFFGGGNSSYIARSTSPFRRAMTESESQATILVRSSPALTLTPPIRNPLYAGPEKGGFKGNQVNGSGMGMDGTVYTESCYSRSTSGQTPMLGNSNVSLPLSEGRNGSVVHLSQPPASEAGEVVIIDRKVYRPLSTISGGGVGMGVGVMKGHKASSSAGSVEWKRWMASEVEKLERGKENLPSHSMGMGGSGGGGVGGAGAGGIGEPKKLVSYMKPSMPRAFGGGHVREGAVGGEDEFVGDEGVMGGGKEKVLGVLVQQSGNISVLKPILKKSDGNLSVIEKGDGGGFGVMIGDGEKENDDIPVPPPLPLRSPLRGAVLKGDVKDVGTPSGSLKGKNVLHKRNLSRGSLRSVRSIRSLKDKESPAKLVKRNRPFVSGGVGTPLNGGLKGEIERVFGRVYGGDGERERERERDEWGSEGSDRSRYRTPGEGRVVEFIGEGLERDDVLGGRFSMEEGEVQKMGSKAMVDLFLSSRRKGGGSEVGGAFL